MVILIFNAFAMENQDDRKKSYFIFPMNSSNMLSDILRTVFNRFRQKLIEPKAKK